MFLSSPARRFGPSARQTTSLGTTIAPRPPYHHQIEESKRDREYERSKKTKEKRIPEGKGFGQSSPISSKIRPGIRRSATHTGIGDPEHHARRQSQVSFADSASSRAPDRTGRISPLKRTVQQAGLDRPPSRARGSLTLAVDENGRAKTVFLPVSDAMDSAMAVDDETSESGQSMESADFNVARSQNNSFAFPEHEIFSSRSAHLMPDSRSHSKNSSYSSARGSSTSTNQSSYNSSVPGTIKTQSRSLNVQPLPAGRFLANNSKASPPSTLLPSRGAWVAGRDEDDGDATQALRAMKKERERKVRESNSYPTYRENSIQSFNSSPPMTSNVFDNYFQQNNISPTTITDPDLETPSTDRDSSSSGIVRCYCNSTGAWGEMIQWYVAFATEQYS
ncbi:MAG: hypothetical protein Q9227_003975 [Pyrenula ochraceoflavens]